MTDINRLAQLCDKLNKIFADEYDPTKEDDNFRGRKRNFAIFVFGFNSKNKEYKTNLINNFIANTEKNWGGDTIKLRIFVNRIYKKYQSKILDFFKYSDWEKDSSTMEKYNSWTIEFDPTEIDLLYKELQGIMNLSD